MKSLQDLTKKNVVLEWKNNHQEAFNKLKKLLVSPPLLAFPDKNKLQILTTDASILGLRAILSQRDINSGEESVIAYGSRTLRGPEVRYGITHLEALGVVWGVHHFRHYLCGKRFLLRTDHSALKYIQE